MSKNSTGKPLRVLALHGHFQNANILRSRLAALAQECSPAIEFVCVDAPHILKASDLTAPSSDLSKEEAAEPTDRRGWFDVDLVPGESYGIAESIAHLREILMRERFDGIFGFSQGAAMGALMTALLERPESYPPFLVNGKPPHPPVKFCIAISGFRPRGAISSAVYKTPYETPTLHVIGRNDIIVIEEHSHRLEQWNNSKRKRLHVHDGGHFIPTKVAWKQSTYNWMLYPTA